MADVQIHGGAYELPKLTLGLRRLMDSADSAPKGEQRWRAEWDALRACIDSETLASALDGARLEDVDINALDALYDAVSRAYGEGDRERTERQVRDVADMLGQLDADKLDALMRLVGEGGTKRPQSRQGFTRVI